MIKIFKSEFCNNCALVSKYLKSNGVSVEEVLVTNEIAEDLNSKGFKMLPVLEVDGRLTGKVSKTDLDVIIAGEKSNA